MPTTTIQIPAMETADIPLKQLIEWEGNVRTTTSNQIEELAASITAEGLLQSLVVQEIPKGNKYVVIAGGRRLSALRRIFGKQNPLIACRVVPYDTTEDVLKEISLAENVHHLSLHPAEEFVAFNQVAELGKTTEEIALRFGVTEHRVKQRLALARVSPYLIEQYKDGKMTLDTLQAFTLTDDHARQEFVWEKAPEYNRHANYIRRALSDASIPATDKRVRYIGLKKYIAEGGVVTQDLFADDAGNGSYITDVDLLGRLLNEKLNLLCAKVEKEGWTWTQYAPDEREASQLARAMTQLTAEYEPLPPKIEKERVKLEGRLRELSDQSEAATEDSESEKIGDQIHTAETRLEEINEMRVQHWTDAQKAVSGVLISLQVDGKPFYRYGLVRKEDSKAAKAAAKANAPASSRNDSEDGPVPQDSIPQEAQVPPTSILLEELTSHRTAALAAELGANTDVALRVLAHRMILEEFGTDFRGRIEGNPAQISVKHFYLPITDDTPAGKTIDRIKSDWISMIPHKEPGQIWKWCLQQNQETILQLIAFCTARSLDTTVRKGLQESAQQTAAVQNVHAALGTDMNNWITLTAENYFSRISKPAMLAAIREAGKKVPKDAEKLKKAELAELTEETLRGTGWLPEVLRRKGSRNEQLDDTETDSASGTEAAGIAEAQSIGA